ncbi:hypothetical protein AAV99_13070 [Aurantiacibacter marinus]|uniref:Uncharacterized protein n=2 Tax=Aurantiacibacter marinus TaxID=874156 RepID=A0A0H0XRZ6_9SPHN|nr:hypothetical protein AAV99_13070 [Aurantiacibacter marinus]
MPELMLDSWMLAGEASYVMWLRGIRLMAGGKLAEQEAGRMVSEKMLASMTLIPAVMAGGIGQSVESAGSRALAHYRKPVRANRRRLSR